ncbi:MAG: class I SAM-dependent methyltransferase, partial [Cyanobacteria bacterium P01_D01_bin.73]
DLNITDQSLDMVLGLSILHLLKDKEAVIAKVYKMLKPGGVFVTSTVCLGDGSPLLKVVAFVGSIVRPLGLFPILKVFTADDLVESLTQAKFTIDYQWQPSKDKAVFIVSKKPE